MAAAAGVADRRDAGRMTDADVRHRRRPGWWRSSPALPLFAAMALAALAFVSLAGLSPSIVPQKMAQAMNSFPIVAAPLFILMGNLLSAARITDRIVRFATAIIGSLRGGYAQASIVSSLIFAGMAGSAVADAAGTGAVEIRAMKRAGYRAETAAAINAAAATIGAIVPPSLPIVIFGVTSDISVGRLFLAGFVPGLLMAALADGDGGGDRQAPGFPEPALRRLRRTVARLPRRVLRPDGAGHPAGRHVQRLVHADRGRRRRQPLRAAARAASSIARCAWPTSCRVLDRHGRDRRASSPCW